MCKIINMNKAWYLLALLFFLSSCKESETIRLVKEWTGKEIIFPSDAVFSSFGKDTLNILNVDHDYAIVSFVDSVGCINCKLQLDRWNDFLQKKDSLFQKKVILAFFLHPNDRRELVDLLREHRFSYPVCIDMKNQFNELNHFPNELAFQTFLIDKNNKVVAIGNPIHNPKVKELYMRIISGNDRTEQTRDKKITAIEYESNIIDFGKFDWKKEQEADFILKNTGTNPLVIDDVATSCGCLTTEFTKGVVLPNGKADIKIRYKADKPEHFNKTVTVYCNIKESLLQLKIMGDAR